MRSCSRCRPLPLAADPAPPDVGRLAQGAVPGAGHVAQHPVVLVRLALRIRTHKVSALSRLIRWTHLALPDVGRLARGAASRAGHVTQHFAMGAGAALPAQPTESAPFAVSPACDDSGADSAILQAAVVAQRPVSRAGHVTQRLAIGVGAAMRPSPNRVGTLW